METKAAGCSYHTNTHHQHILAYAADGELFMCGSNAASQLAMKNVTSMAQPQRAAALDTHIVDTVACGSNFTVAVTKRGELIGWGAGEYGQIGPPCVVQQPVPRIIKEMSPAARIERVAAGSAHVLALSEHYQVYSFGAGLHGALGHGNTDSTCVQAFQILPLPNHTSSIPTRAFYEPCTNLNSSYGQLHPLLVMPAPQI